MKTSTIIFILILIAIIVLSLHSLMQYQANSKMQKTVRSMEQQMEKASQELSQARLKLSNLKSELNKLQNFLDSSNRKVNRLNEGRSINLKQYEAERINIVHKLNDLYISIDSTGKSLPEIQLQE